MNTMLRHEWEYAIARALVDGRFQAALLANPIGTLRDYGLELDQAAIMARARVGTLREFVGDVLAQAERVWGSRADDLTCVAHNPLVGGFGWGSAGNGGGGPMTLDLLDGPWSMPGGVPRGGRDDDRWEHDGWGVAPPPAAHLERLEQWRELAPACAPTHRGVARAGRRARMALVIQAARRERLRARRLALCRPDRRAPSRPRAPSLICAAERARHRARGPRAR